jgi:hypothetical protein
LIETSKHQSINFTVPHNTLLHGFAGYFDSKLYGDVHISMRGEGNREGGEGDGEREREIERERDIFNIEFL